MKEMKRILALVLCLVMLVGVIPVGAFATETDLEIIQEEEIPADENLGGDTDVIPEEEEDTSDDELTDPENEIEIISETESIAVPGTTYVLAGGDYQEAGDHSNSSNNVAQILTALGTAGYATMDGFIFVGDYDCETHDDSTETAAGIWSLMDTVDNKYANLNHDNTILVQGNHDTMDSNIDNTGAHLFSGYAVYVLNEDHYPNGGGTDGNIQNLASALDSWLDSMVEQKYEKPIFIASHLPLHFGPRTNAQGDGIYARYIFDALNAAGEAGLNIIFLFGHDHAYGTDNYIGGEAIYLAKGDTINIAQPGSRTQYDALTLNFTYMNAGYVGYYSEEYPNNTTAGTDMLTMTVFAITDNNVEVVRYNLNGRYNMKSAGRSGSYNNVSSDSLGLTPNTTVYASPQNIELESFRYGTTDNGYVGTTPEVNEDVTTGGKDWITITAHQPGTEATPDSTVYQYTLDENGLDGGSNYLIVGSGSAYALTGNSGTIDATGVDISANGETITLPAPANEWTINADGTITNGTYYLTANPQRNSCTIGLSTNENNAYNWTISPSGGGQYTIVADYMNYRFHYLYYTNNSFSTTRNNNPTVRLYGNRQTVTTPGTDAQPAVPGLYAKLDGELTYNVASGTSVADALAAVKNGIAIKYATLPDYSDVKEYADDGDGMSWTLDPAYNGTTPGDYAVTIAYNGTAIGTAKVVVPAAAEFYVAKGEQTLYTVPQNTTVEAALAEVKEGITVYKATDSNGSNAEIVDDALVTWTMDETYDPKTAGQYKVSISCNGADLGYVIVEVTINYDTGLNQNWVEVGEAEATGGTHTYTLDTNGIDIGADHKYIIVGSNQPYALTLSNGTIGTARVSINGQEATVEDRAACEFYFAVNSRENGTYLLTQDGSQTVYHANGNLYYGNDNKGYWRMNSGSNGAYQVYDFDNQNWYLNYGYAWASDSVSRFAVSSNTRTVRLYKYTGTEGAIPGGTRYAMLEGPDTYTVTNGTGASTALNKVKQGITGYLATDTSGANKTEIPDNDLIWTWLNTYNGDSNGSYWVQISYKLHDTSDPIVLGTVKVVVQPGVVDNYPEYPNEGAVRVQKTATGIDFQSTGVAQVELSASGVPVKKGADVILMLDTSSSMQSHNVTGTNRTRAAVLEASLKNLITQLKGNGPDGQPLDIRVAIADFNGFYGDNHSQSGTPYDRDATDTMSDGINYNANSQARVYTGTNNLTYGAFVDAQDLAATYSLNYTSGTNYDYAFDAIYQLGTASRNSGEDRDLFVIFMSDGAAMQWNFYHSQGPSSIWNDWLVGSWSTLADVERNLANTSHSYYYNMQNTDGDDQLNEHRMANAVKGAQGSEFEVIRQTSDLGTPVDGYSDLYMVPGLGATVFSISFDAQADNKVTAESMDKSIASLASPQTGTTQYYYKVTSENALGHAFDSIGTAIAYAASNARFVDQMGENFDLQMKPIVDVQGNPVLDANRNQIMPTVEILSYDIYTLDDFKNGNCTENMIGTRKGTYKVLETITFNADGTEAYSDQIGAGVNILADGTQAGYVKGVIYAKTFLYNTNSFPVDVTGVNIPTTIINGTTSGNSTTLDSETFYWKMDTIQTSELAMRYYVYLSGSMEGRKEAGSYATNQFATLYYDNYLGNHCYQETVSPVIAWQSANVSYAFYLVNDKGQVIVNQTTGETGTFANKIAVTTPVVFDEILLNNIETVEALDVVALGDNVLPKYYTLYDEDASYQVKIYSDSSLNSWDIYYDGSPTLPGPDNELGTEDDVTNTPTDKVQSTYVTGFDTTNAAAYSTAVHNDSNSTDYTHTTVWFAVLWNIEAHPDTVVVDHGLPVDISVMANDMFGEYGRLEYIGPVDDEFLAQIENDTVPMSSNVRTGFARTYTGQYGSAAVNLTTGKVRYTPTGMQMDSHELFAYAVNYTGQNNPGYYYDTITVIPATTIYYEDSFLTFKTFKDADDSLTGTWGYEGTAVNGATQAEDRPGAYSLTDANNIYGYDGVNLGMSTFSLGRARVAHVDADSYATAEFTFTGTGFDIIGMTSNTTGALAVQVKNADGVAVVSKVVNTYYGYTSTLYQYTYTNGKWVKAAATGSEVTSSAAIDAMVADPQEGDTYVKQEWEATPGTQNAIYQVPVLQAKNLPYGTYSVKLTATYMSFMDKTGTGGYDLYLDAVRIYDPANNGANNQVIKDAYLADHEGWPTYVELRNGIIAANSFDKIANDALNPDMKGLVFIDGDSSVGNSQMADYVSYGPNNEIYLAPGQRIAFMIKAPENLDRVHMGVKCANGKDCSVTVSNVAAEAIPNTSVTAGDYFNYKTRTFDTSTDMYYDITGYSQHIIVVSNTGDRYGMEDGIVSLTNLKFTYTSSPSEAGGMQSGSAADAEPVVEVITAEEIADFERFEAYIYMNAEAAELVVRAVNAMDGEDNTPEADEPEQIIPEETQPEETQPEETQPEETQPEETIPEETIPEETVPQVFEPEFFEAKLSAKSVRVGKTVKVTVTTSDDVAYITVNGETVTNYKTERKTGNRVWTVNVKAEEAGEMEIIAIAYDADGNAGIPFGGTVTVTGNSGDSTVNKIKNAINNIVSWLFNL